MTDERNEQRGDERDGKPRGALRLVPDPPPVPQPSDDDELRELIRQVQRPRRRRDSPSDDPPRAA